MSELAGSWSRRALPGIAFALVAGFAFWASARGFDAGRPDFFYLADAFLHGRVWLPEAFGVADVVIVGDRVYVPFAPFPAIALVPLVAALGPAAAAAWQPLVNASLAALDVGLVWLLASRLGVRATGDRAWLALLFGFSTQIWWVTTRGGVWHTAHLIAALLTLASLVEVAGRRRPFLLGLLAGAAFLTRAPLALAVPYLAWVLIDTGAEDARTGSAIGRVVAVRAWPWRRLGAYGVGLLPAFVFFAWYNDVRFGAPLDSGYGRAALNPWLEELRAIGLFSLAHLPMNLDYLLFKLPSPFPTFPWFKPDGLGMSILITSPGLLLAARADWRRREAIALGLTAIVVLIPSLLYYGGGWYQFGYRYALDSIPFVVALCGLAAARRGVGPLWRLLILAGVVVGLGGLWWAYH